MARIGVFSDTHGSIENLRYLTDRLGQLDSLFHLGDCVEDVPMLAARLNTGFVSVRGNCDPWAEAPLQQIIPWHGHRILLLHGHTHMGRLSLSYKAKAEQCDVVCSGHTHVASVEEYDGVLLINPGSLSRPRSAKGPSCAVLTVTEESVDAELLYCNSEVSKSLPFRHTLLD